MADIIDLAQPQESMEIEAAVRQALIPPAGCDVSPVWEDGVAHCGWCDAVIPKARLEALPNTGLCVDCAASAQESRSRKDH